MIIRSKLILLPIAMAPFLLSRQKRHRAKPAKGVTEIDIPQKIYMKISKNIELVSE